MHIIINRSGAWIASCTQACFILYIPKTHYTRRQRHDQSNRDPRQVSHSASCATSASSLPKPILSSWHSQSVARVDSPYYISQVLLQRSMTHKRRFLAMLAATSELSLLLSGAVLICSNRTWSPASYGSGILHCGQASLIAYHPIVCQHACSPPLSEAYT